MKKKYYLFVLFFLVNYVGFSQKLKVDLDPYSFTYEYVELPQYYTDPENRTFSIVTNNGTDYRSIFDNAEFSRRININGFKQVSSGGNVNADVMLENLIVDNGVVTDIVSRKSDGSTTVTGYRTSFSVRGMGRCMITCKGVVTNIPLNFNQSITRDFSNRTEASRYSSDNATSLKQQYSRQFAEQSIDKIFTDLNKMYGYRIISAKGNLWVLMSTENPEYQGHQDALKNIQSAFANLTYSTDPLPTYQAMGPVISYYESLIAKYNDSEDKKHKKIRYASYFNIMNIYYALDLPEKAKAAADALFANDYDKNDGKTMSDKSNQLSKSLNVNSVIHRHMQVDPLYIR